MFVTGSQTKYTYLSDQNFGINRKNLGIEKSLLSFSRNIKDICYTKALKKSHRTSRNSRKVKLRWDFALEEFHPIKEFKTKNPFTDRIFLFDQIKATTEEEIEAHKNIPK